MGRNEGTVQHTIYLVASCSDRKCGVIHETLQLRALRATAPSRRAEQWWRRLAETDDTPRTPALRLYGGEHWTHARRSLATLIERGYSAELWAASAGYGLVPASARLRPYSATFSCGSPDSVAQAGVSRVEQMQRWWAALAEYPGPEAGAPRSLHALASRDSLATLIIVAAPHYIRAQRIDLLAARRALVTPSQLIVVSNHELLADTELAPNLIPVDERCQTVVGGTMVGLNARVAHRLLAGGPITAPCLRGRYDEMVCGAGRPDKHSRDRMGDEEVLTFLRAGLRQDPRAGWTVLLRALRGDGRACEQRRLRALHGQVREELASAGPGDDRR